MTNIIETKCQTAEFLKCKVRDIVKLYHSKMSQNDGQIVILLNLKYLN